jgi:hypothetical protein
MTRAILRLRASAQFGSIGVVGVGGTSALEGWGSEGGRGTEWTRTRRWVSRTNGDLAASISGTSDSSVEQSDVLSSDSLDEEEEERESDGSGKLSELARGSSRIEHWR